MPDKQLRMYLRNLSDLPDIQMPDGYEIRTYKQGDEAAWAAIMNTGIGEWTADTCVKELTSKPQFLTDGLYFAVCDGIPVGSACAWRLSEDDWKHGYLHMVCVIPEHRGKQLGYMLTLAVLRYFKEHKFTDVSLDTDDWRVPAIKAYLRLGFKPHFYDDSHRQRWDKIMAEIKDKTDK